MDTRCEVIENLYKFEVVCQEAIYKFRILGANDVLFCATRPKATQIYQSALNFIKINKKTKTNYFILNWRCKNCKFQPFTSQFGLALQFALPIELILASAVLLCLPVFAVRCFCLPASGRRTVAHCWQHSRASSDQSRRDAAIIVLVASPCLTMHICIQIYPS